jgi:hypothetical protein
VVNQWGSALTSPSDENPMEIELRYDWYLSKFKKRFGENKKSN